jgi:CRISPR-associated protein Csb1
LYKIQRFLGEGLRLRTACDLLLKDELKATSPTGFVVPSAAELSKQLATLISDAGKEKGLLSSSVLRLKTKTVKKEKKGSTEEAEGNA